jgi:hypothetical protein
MPQSGGKITTSSCQVFCLAKDLDDTCDTTRQCCGAYSKQCGGNSQKIADEINSSLKPVILPLPKTKAKKQENRNEDTKGKTGDLVHSADKKTTTTIKVSFFSETVNYSTKYLPKFKIHNSKNKKR